MVKFLFLLKEKKNIIIWKIKEFPFGNSFFVLSKKLIAMCPKKTQKLKILLSFIFFGMYKLLSKKNERAVLLNNMY